MSEQENLNFIIDNTKIAELFGIQNFSKLENAVLELVKNAYDAGSSSVDINFYEDEVVIKDNGCGMDREDILEFWMHVGKSDKKYEFSDSQSNKRVYAGSKGIGRFAIARIGKIAELKSKKANSQCILWKTDWQNNTLELVDDISFYGTEIKIYNLRDRINQSFIEKLSRYLGRTNFDSLFEINLFYKGKKFACRNPFKSIIVGETCLSMFRLRYNKISKTLNFDLSSDEFSSEAQKFLDEIGSDINVSKFSSIDLLSAASFEQILDFEKDEIDEALNKLGNFDATFCFNNNPNKQDVDMFLYKRSKENSISFSNEGIALFRNAFCIAGFDGSNDWLNLGKRVRKSPAAASHQTGSWRVRDNQLSGYVYLDKNENHLIKEIQNRQGIVEDVYYEVFKAIVIKGIECFEKYRQAIIRKINTKNKINKDNNLDPKIDEFIKDPKKAKNYSEKELNELAKSVEKERKQHSDNEQIYKQKAESQEYNIRLLNSLSTIGLNASWKAHELDNCRNNLSDFTINITNSLQKSGCWNTLLEYRKGFSTENVPTLLQKNDKATKKVLFFIDSMLTSIEKKKFSLQNLKPHEVLQSIVNKWKNQYSWLVFNLNVPELIFNSSEDIFETIFDNLILNSIQQNYDFKELEISISLFEQGSSIYFKYSDNGRGLSDKYINHPMDILEPHETTRKNGHGLGMWIVNNTILTCGGEIVEIQGSNGFLISFTLGDISNGKEN